MPRRVTVGGAVSRFPSSDIDLAFVVEDRHPADAVADVLRSAGGDLLESVHLFDVYRGPGHRRGRAQPGLPPALLLARPHADRRGGRSAAHPLHRGGDSRSSAPPCAEAHRPARPGPARRGKVGRMEVRPIDPADDGELAEWYAVLACRRRGASGPTGRASAERDIRAFASCTAARHAGSMLLAAGETGGPDPRRRPDGAAAARQPPQRGGHGGGPSPATGATVSGRPRRRHGRRWPRPRAAPS